MMSRGVGNIRNRKEVIELIKAGAAKFIDEKLLAGTKELEGIDDAAAFVDEMQDPPRQLHEIQHAYISFE
jgi:hypothetical protein